MAAQQPAQQSAQQPQAVQVTRQVVHNVDPMAKNYTVLFEGQPTCCGDCTGWSANRKWLITDKFIQREEGLCCVTVDNLQIIRIKDISFLENCCCKCRNHIKVVAIDDTDPELIIYGLPDGQRVYQNLRNALNAAHGNALNFFLVLILWLSWQFKC